MARITTTNRQTLPQDYIINSGTLFESFQTIGDWTSSGTAGGASSIDSSIYTEGTGSLKIVANASASSNWYATKTISKDFSASGVISFDVYIPDESSITNVAFYISSTTGFTKYFSKTVSAIHIGWNRIRLPKSIWGNTGSEDWANTMIRLRVRVNSSAAGAGIAYFDNMTFGDYSRPKVIWTCDDGWASQIDELYAYANPRGVKTTHAIVGSYIGTGSYMTLANLQTLYDNGCDIINHTYNHTNLTTLGTQAEMETEILLNKDYLTNSGFIRGNMHLHFVYPNGGYNQTVLDALTAQGYLTARTVISSAGMSNATPILSPLLLVTRNLGNTTTLASAKADVDYAIETGATLVIESHKFVASAAASTEWGISDMQALVDYIVSKSAEIDSVTISEWYNGLDGRRTTATSRSSATNRTAVN